VTLERAIDDLVRQVDGIRLELLRFKRLVREDREAAADKTPVRPPSQSAFQAFQASAEFMKNPPP
jgi:hypothetical protein